MNKTAALRLLRNIEDGDIEIHDSGDILWDAVHALTKPPGRVPMPGCWRMVRDTGLLPTYELIGKEVETPLTQCPDEAIGGGLSLSAYIALADKLFGPVGKRLAQLNKVQPERLGIYSEYLLDADPVVTNGYLCLGTTAAMEKRLTMSLLAPEDQVIEWSLPPMKQQAELRAWTKWADFIKFFPHSGGWRCTWDFPQNHGEIGTCEGPEFWIASHILSFLLSLDQEAFRCHPGEKTKESEHVPLFLLELDDRDENLIVALASDDDVHYGRSR